MTDTRIVRAPYSRGLQRPYTGQGERIVAAAQRQMSEAFARYHADIERIDTTRRLDATEKVGAKLDAIRQTLPYVEHPEEIAELLLHTTALGKVLREQSRRVEALRIGGRYAPSLGHVELGDFVARYLNTHQRRPGGLVIGVILYGNDPTLQRMRDLIITDETISGNRAPVIPNEHIQEFTELFVGSPANGGNGFHRQIGPQEARRLLETAEWPEE